MSKQREKKYIANDLLLDSDEFVHFLAFLRKKNLEYTYSESYSDDLVEYRIFCRPLLYDWFCTYYFTLE